MPVAQSVHDTEPISAMAWLRITLVGLAAGLIVGVAGFIGDVVISALKRDLGIKDSGTLLPGHGGVLDRFDALFFTLPVASWYLFTVLPGLRALAAP